MYKWDFDPVGPPRDRGSNPNSTEYAVMVQVISEGPIQGLYDGLHSVFINDTPMLDSADDPNYHAVALAMVKGTNTQSEIPGIPGQESETGVNEQVSVAGGAKTYVIATAGIDAIRVRIAVPMLKIYDTNGGERSASVQIQIERQSPNYTPSGGALGDWEILQLPWSGYIRGKFSSKYTASYRIDTPAAGPWSIRVTRLTADHTSGAPDYTQDETWVDAYTEINDVLLRMPYTAVMALKVGAQQFQQIPKFSAELLGRIVSVPSNYTEASQDPVTKVWTPAVYTGIWDGTFVQAWTGNPAWIWYDLVTNTRYGAGSVIPAESVDKWALYTIAEYCDELVYDGKGGAGTEPRFRCSVYIQNQAEALTLINDLASIFRGMAYSAGGLVTAVQDAPASAVGVFTASNVKDGRFSFQGSARKARHTVALVSWIDPDNGYKTAIEYVEDHDAIVRYGFNSVSFAALGATSQAQARRMGLWKLLTESMETEVVSFTSALEGASLRPGDIIALATGNDAFSPITSVEITSPA